MVVRMNKNTPQETDSGEPISCGATVKDPSYGEVCSGVAGTEEFASGAMARQRK